MEKWAHHLPILYSMRMASHSHTTVTMTSHNMTVHYYLIFLKMIIKLSNRKYILTYYVS